MKKHLPLKITVSLFLLLATFITSLCFGAEKISILHLLSGSATDFERLIFYKLRLPRSLIVLITGALLAGSGSIFQLFFRNPLAEPGIMGISAGATLGAVIAQTTGLTAASAYLSSQNLFAFAGALLAGFIISTLSLFQKKTLSSTVMLLLCGSALGSLYSSITSILLIVNPDKLTSVYSWLSGSFNSKGLKELRFIIFPAIASVILMFFLASPLELLSDGETSARALGLNVKLVRFLVIIAGALSASCAAVCCGTLSFVGLVAPHIVRKLISPKGKSLFCFSLIYGAILLLLSDTIARTVIAPAELPTGIITAIIGVPFFISLIIGAKHEQY